MRPIVQGIGIGVLTVGVAVALIFGLTWMRGATASFFGQADAEVQLESANSRIARYEHFFDLCGAIEGYEDQIAILTTQLATTDESDTKEMNRLRSTIAGLEGQRARAIRQYNADAQKDYTAARFRASKLPYQLNVDGVTRCDV